MCHPAVPSAARCCCCLLPGAWCTVVAATAALLLHLACKLQAREDAEALVASVLAAGEADFYASHGAPWATSAVGDWVDNPNSNVLVLMADSRSLHERPVGYHQVAAKINMLYSMRHGYSFRYMQFPCLARDDDAGKKDSSPKDCACAVHARYNERAAPWCKLLAINESMHLLQQEAAASASAAQGHEGTGGGGGGGGGGSSEAGRRYRYIVYMDSDAVFYNHFLDIGWVYKLSFAAQTALTLFENNPWPVQTSRGRPLGCTGIMFWRNTPEARKLVQQWWDFPVRDYYNMHHEYEQAALHALVEARQYDLDRAMHLVLPVKTFEVDGDQQYIQHVRWERDRMYQMLLVWKRWTGLEMPEIVPGGSDWGALSKRYTLKETRLNV